MAAERFQVGLLRRGADGPGIQVRWPVLGDGVTSEPGSNGCV
jgi:hypothetical protein